MDNIDINKMLETLSKMDKAELEKNLKIAKEIINKKEKPNKNSN